MALRPQFSSSSSAWTSVWFKVARPCLAAFLVALAVDGSSATGTSAPAAAHSAEFDCGRNWWEAVTAFLGGDWSEEKKGWCCEHRKVGCEAKSAKEVRYDCREGFAVRNQAWSPEKRTWCCNHEQLGCLTDVWNAEPYDCLAGLSHWAETWSQSKKAWCCEFEGHGCQRPRTTTSTEPFDCSADVLRWRTRWSSKQQAWCCEHYGRGCVSPTQHHRMANINATFSGDYNCSEGLMHWETQWSLPKQAVCCLESSRCRKVTTTLTSTTLTTMELFDCKLDSPDWVDIWTGWKKEWCCDHHGVGCPPTTTTLTTSSKPFDCLEEGWPAAKRQWCCKNELRGCTACDIACVVAGFPASCRNRIEWLERHDLKLQENACTRAHHVVLEECPACRECDTTDACPAIANMAQKFDCEAGLSKAARGWSQEKKEWCCKFLDRGCPPMTTVTTTSTTTLPLYNCTSGTSDWKRRWSPKKKAWCCTNAKVGCTECDAPCVIDSISASCRDRVGWLLGHVLKQRNDTCIHAHGLVLAQCISCQSCEAADACPSSAATFDCQAGLVAWHRSWSEPKRSWCCRHEGLACREAKEGDSPRNPSRAQTGYSCGPDSSTWPREKREWCCAHHRRGCSTAEASTSGSAVASTVPTSTPVPKHEPFFQCQEDVLSWALSWSQMKKDFCCQHYSLGCPKPVDAKRVQWVARNALPDIMGETLTGYNKNMGGLQDMMRWCEANTTCVGFAFQPESWRWVPKKVGTGFDARRATWTTDKWHRQSWRWYFMMERAGNPHVQVSVKFEQLHAARPLAVNGIRGPSPLSSKVPWVRISCMGFAGLVALACIAGIGHARSLKSDRLGCSYASLSPAFRRQQVLPTLH